MTHARQLTEEFHESLGHKLYRDSDRVRTFCSTCMQVWWGGEEEFSGKVEVLVKG